MELVIRRLDDDFPGSKLRPVTGNDFAALPHGRSHHADSTQNFLGKCNQQAAEHTEDSLGALGGVVGLDGHAQLDDAPAQNNDADGFDTGKNELRQVVDDGKGIGVSRQGRAGQNGAQGHGKHGGEIETADPFGPPLT